MQSNFNAMVNGKIATDFLYTAIRQILLLTMFLLERLDMHKLSTDSTIAHVYANTKSALFSKARTTALVLLRQYVTGLTEQSAEIRRGSHQLWVIRNTCVPLLANL